jgi:nucleoid DNA-binding protein
MSRGDLQEMEQSKTAVNANAAPAQPIEKLPGASYEDLGGPTPENYSPTDDSAKLKEPNIATVKDVVNSKAAKVDAMKSTAKEEVATEEEVLEEDQVGTDEVVVEYDVEEDVNALLGGEELSEEFREKAKIIFEAALTSKVKGIQESLETQYTEALAEEAQAQKAELQERVDSYLEYVAQEWMSENQLAIEHGLQTEMTESFLAGMKGLFEEHYVTIPEDKYDVLESMVEKLDDMETKLNEQIEKNISLNGRLAESVADGILDSVSEGLASTQKEKLASLAESVEFESEEEYREKLETLKESYFSRTTAAKSESPQTISEGVDTTQDPSTGSMDAYLKTLGAFKK